jgi:hypothetical protein
MVLTSPAEFGSRGELVHPLVDANRRRKPEVIKK